MRIPMNSKHRLAKTERLPLRSAISHGVDLVQWLAEISDQPLDWLELPGDRVNLRSPGRYTVAQTRDLFNRYLLARGYTLLEIDGGLTVAKTATINPAIVPRVSPEALSDLPPYTFVRTSLDVGWLSAEKLSKELLPMISSNGRLTSLSTTNRIEAMDAAVNLKQVVSLLTQERSTASRSALAPEFQLRYLSAKEAKRLLEEFLNIKKEADGPMSPEQIQMMMQAQQQNGGTPVAAKETKISIVANVRQKFDSDQRHCRSRGGCSRVSKTSRCAWRWHGESHGCEITSPGFSLGFA